MAQYIGVNGVARKVTSPYIGVDGVARNVKNGYVGVDGVARLFFAPEGGGAAILEVEKIVSDTYANSTQYTAEEFILLDIYPKTGGTVNVTYGGLTKTITDTSGAEEPNAQQVFFGTFNGVSNSVATPSSGELTIEGDYYAFGCGGYVESSKLAVSTHCSCVTKVLNFGEISVIPPYAFIACEKLTLDEIPQSVTSIGFAAFTECTNLALTSLPSGITSIANSSFDGCTNLALTSLPSGITSINDYAFRGCTNLALTSLPSGITSIGSYAFYGCTNLALTSLPSGITSIGSNVFYNCRNLVFDSLLIGITSIGSKAFHMVDVATGEGIKMLAQTLTVPSEVTSIGDQAFSFTNTSGSGSGVSIYIATVKMLGATPPEITGKPFGSVEVRDYAYAITRLGKEFKIIVPSGCGNAYKTAENWSHYADYIVEAT